MRFAVLCPIPGYLKLNVHGSIRDGVGMFGGVLRSETGEWLWDFAGKCGNTSHLHAELMGVKVGLEKIVARGHLQVIIETDSSEAVNLVDGFPGENHPLLHLVMECKSLHKKVWSYSINHVSLVYNLLCAHKLAGIGHDVSSQEGSILFVDNHHTPLNLL
ncbi:hypothetical protein LguiA_016127 [Lonicera macranthoides]